MLNFKNKDERIENEKRKVESEAYKILILFLAVSLVVQKFFLDAPLEQILVELIGLIGGYLYVEVRNITSGNYTFTLKSDKNIVKKMTINALITTVVYLFITGIRDVAQIIFFFLGFTILSIGFSLIVIYFNKRKEEKIEKELNECEDIIE